VVEPVCLESWYDILVLTRRGCYTGGNEAGTMYDCLTHTRCSVAGVGVGKGNHNCIQLELVHDNVQIKTRSHVHYSYSPLYPDMMQISLERHAML
jgi:hypothetical protein